MKFIKISTNVFRFMLIIIINIILLNYHFVFAANVKINETFTINNFGAVTLSGVDQIIKTSFTAFQIQQTKSRGSWHVDVSATQLVNQSNASKKIHQGAITISTPTSIYKAPNTTTDISSIARYSGAIDTTTSLKYLDANSTTDIGNYNVNGVQLSLTIYPSEAFTGTYNTTITINAIVGP